MEHKGTAILETEQLLLRPFRGSDGDAMFRNWTHDPEVTRFLTWQPHADVGVSRQLAARWEEEAKKPEVYQWAIVPKELGEPIGSISVVDSEDKPPSAEIGYCIGRAWWGRGLAAEALRAVIEYLIREVGMRRVWARHDVNNPRSGRVMQKAGMRKEGVFRSFAANTSNPCCDMAIYSILPEELDKPSEPSFRPLSRSRQALTTEESIAVLQREKRGVLSLQGDMNYPYALPINHWYDPADGKLYFHSGQEGHKIDAMRRDPRACFCVTEKAELAEDGWSWYFNSVVVFGKLQIVRDHEKALQISRELSYRFTDDRDYIEWELSHSGHRVLCFALIPEHISGKRVHEK